jgi:hypothetical protein
MTRSSAVWVIFLVITASAVVPAPAAAPADVSDAKRLADLGADTTTPRGAIKLYVLALKNEFGLRLSDLVAPAGKDDETFIADHDALTAAVTRLRAASTDHFGEGATQKLAGGILAQPGDEQLRALFARMDQSLPAGEAKDESVKLGAAANQFYAMSAVNRDGKWKIALLPQVTTPLVVLAELGDLPAFADAIGALADGVAKRRVASSKELETGLNAAIRARGESIRAAPDLKALQGTWERKPIGEELGGNVVARVIGTVNGVHLTTRFLNHEGGLHMALRTRMTPRLSGGVRIMTFTGLEHPEGPDFGFGRKGTWRTTLYALRKDAWIQGVGFLEDDNNSAVGTIEWTRLPEKPAAPQAQDDNGKAQKTD